MKRLVYAPRVYAYVKNAVGEVYNLSEDIISGSITRRTNAASQAQLVLNNYGSKAKSRYMGKFKPNDRLVIWLKKVKPILVFSGFLDSSTIYQAVPGPVTLSASCTLKKLEFTPFDPALPHVADTLMRYGFNYNMNTGEVTDFSTHGGSRIDDRGFGALLHYLVHEVGGFPAESVHVLSIPQRWIQVAAELWEEKRTDRAEVRSYYADVLNSLLTGNGKQGASGDYDFAVGDYPGEGNDVELAHWMAGIAQKRNIPPELPVMTVLVETGGGAVGRCGSNMNNPGPGEGDKDSVGYFQQRDSWGTVEQRLDPTYALNKFLDKAERTRGQPVVRTSHNTAIEDWMIGKKWGELGEKGYGAWCQAIQVSGHPEKYQAQLPCARSLLDQPSSFKKRDRARPKTISSDLVKRGGVGGAEGPVELLFTVGTRTQDAGIVPTILVSEKREPEHRQYTRVVEFSNEKNRNLAASLIVRKIAKEAGDKAVDYTHPVTGNVKDKINNWGESENTTYNRKVNGLSLQVIKPAGTKRLSIRCRVLVTDDPIDAAFGENVPEKKAKSVTVTNFEQVINGDWEQANASQVNDIRAGLIDARLLGLIVSINQIAGVSFRASSLKSDHSVNNGDHPKGRAMDIDKVADEAMMTGGVEPGPKSKALWQWLLQNAPKIAKLSPPVSDIILGSPWRPDGTFNGPDYPSVAEVVQVDGVNVYLFSDHAHRHHIHVGFNGDDRNTISGGGNGFRNLPITIENLDGEITGGSGGGSGTGGTDGEGGGDISPLTAAFNVTYTFPGDRLGALLLTGERALQNDVMLLETVLDVGKGSLREIASHPNGDFMAWFPDYFNASGHTPYLRINEAELIKCDIDLSDKELATHVYVAGNTYGGLAGEKGNVSFINQIFGEGVVTIESAFLLDSFMSQNSRLTDLAKLKGKKRIEAIERATDDINSFLERYGPRPHYVAQPTIRHPIMEFFIAYQTFQRKWAEQFQSNVSFTFMPELFPGTIIELPDKMCFYVGEVTHSFSYGGGFDTSATLMAPSTIKGYNMGFALLDKPIATGGNLG